MLKQEQIDMYRDDGYLVVDKFIDADKIKSLMHRAEHLIEEFDSLSHTTVFSTNEQERTSNEYFIGSADKVRFFFEEGAIDDSGNFRVEKSKSINKIGHAQHIIDPIYKKVVDSLQFEVIARQLGLNKPIAIQSMHIFKQPMIGGEVGLHQDSTFLYTEPMSCVGFWLALEDATIENGCLQAIPGGHKYPLKKRFLRSKGGEMKFEVLDDSEWQEQELKVLEVVAGTMIILHGQLPHYSAANKSKQSRQAFSVHLVDSKCHYPKDNWLQTDLV